MTTQIDYNHRYWPSPRAVNFVRYLRNRGYYCDVQNPAKIRLTHAIALNILAKIARCSVDELLKINPLTYAEKYIYIDPRNLSSFYLLRGYYEDLSAKQWFDNDTDCKNKNPFKNAQT